MGGAAWRQKPAPVTEMPLDVIERRQVLAWAKQGGGDLTACARWTRLTADVCQHHLAELQAAGLVASKRQVVNPFRSARA